MLLHEGGLWTMEEKLGDEHKGGERDQRNEIGEDVEERSHLYPLT